MFEAVPSPYLVPFDGSFRIPDVPSGEYVVEAIHESFGRVRGKVVVEAGQSTGFALTFD